MARHLARTAGLSIGSRRAASPKHLHLLRRQLSVLVGIHRLEDLARRIASNIAKLPNYLAANPESTDSAWLPKVADKIGLDTALNHNAVAFGFLAVNAVAAAALCATDSASIANLSFRVFCHGRLTRWFTR